MALVIEDRLEGGFDVGSWLRADAGGGTEARPDAGGGTEGRPDGGAGNEPRPAVDANGGFSTTPWDRIESGPGDLLEGGEDGGGSVGRLGARLEAGLESGDASPLS